MRNKHCGVWVVSELRDRGLDLIRHGATTKEAAAELGVPLTRMEAWRKYAVRKGWLEPHVRPEPQYFEVARLAKEGLSNPEIAERMGATVKRVGSMKYRARAVGLLPPVAGMTQGPPLGSVGLVMNGLSDEIRVWLEGQVPSGSCVADVLRMLVVDAYDEEVGE